MNVVQTTHAESMGLFLIRFAADPTIEIPEQFTHYHNPYYNYFCSTPWNLDNPITLVVQDTPLLRQEAVTLNLTDMMLFGANLDSVTVLTLTQVYDLRMKRIICNIFDGIIADLSEDVAKHQLALVEA